MLTTRAFTASATSRSYASTQRETSEPVEIRITSGRPLSKAHAAMLAKTGIISAQDAKRIAHGLDTILSEIEAGKFTFKRALEDIHMNVESRLSELIGPAAGRLHTARSRNDQVATDFKLWVRDAIDETDAALARL